MRRIITYGKLALNRIEAAITELRRAPDDADDTVEAQAKTFRIWMWSTAMGLTLIVISSVISMAGESSEVKTKSATAEPSVLASMPEGYVIAPIEPTNSDSLDSIFDEHGYADLYRASSSDTKAACIARGLPLLRAPKNRRRFAVLVPEGQSAVLAELNEPVLVVLRKKPLKLKTVQRTARDSQSKWIRKSPLVREADRRIDLIEEDIPEIAPTPETGAKS
jgi:hypothetical protein